MKTLGIVGGLGHESTIDYYRSLVADCRAREGRSPPLVIDSLDVTRMLELLDASPSEAASYLIGSLRRLAGAGADIALIAANTPHLVFDEVANASPLPLIDIVECACAEARARRLGTVGLLGTRLTMESGFYQRAGAKAGVRIVTPDDADRHWVHQAYVGELLKGRFLDETHAAMLGVVERLGERDGAQGVILAGTELTLLLRQPAHEGIVLLDTTRLHVERAIEVITGRREVVAPIR